jgi:hypothetical protein
VRGPRPVWLKHQYLSFFLLSKDEKYNGPVTRFGLLKSRSRLAKTSVYEFYYSPKIENMTDLQRAWGLHSGQSKCHHPL